jgi:urease accessory protein
MNPETTSTSTTAAANAAAAATAAAAYESVAARLRLYQLVSPALPVGAFSYAEGLEVLVQSGRLADAATVQHWLEAELRRGAVRLEAAALPGLTMLLRQWRQLVAAEQLAIAEPTAVAEPSAIAEPTAVAAHTAVAGHTAVGAAAARGALVDRDGWLLAQRDAPELRAQQRQMGGSLLQLLADLGWPLPLATPLAWPAAFAWAGVCLEISPAELVEAYLYGWVANQLSAAVRLVPLGPTQAQRLQLRLAPLLADQSAQLVATEPERLWSGGVGAALAQLAQAELYSRLFRS